MQTDQIVTILVAIIGSGALTAIINNVAAKKRKGSSLEQAVTFLLADSIRRECQEHINNNEIGASDLERLEKAWTIYHDGLGGNGFLDSYMHDVKKLQKKVTI